MEVTTITNKEDTEEIEREIYEKMDYIINNSNDEKRVKRIEKLKKDFQESNNDNEPNKTDIIKMNKINKRLSFFQRFMELANNNVNIDPSRILALTDGIFGMVMTLLIFNISLPETQITSYNTFITFIFELAPSVGITIVSFILLTSFWIYHHEFIKIKSLNMMHLWINALFLLSISFIPFTTSLIGHYSYFFLSEVLFGLNVFLTLLMLFLTYYHAYHRGFLENMPSEHGLQYTVNTFAMLMFLTVVINLLDYSVSGIFIYLFLLIPLISLIRDTLFQMKEM